MDVDGDDVDGGDKPKGKKGKGKKAGATSAGLEKPPVADENPEGDAGDGETPGKKKGKKAKKLMSSNRISKIKISLKNLRKNISLSLSHSLQQKKFSSKEFYLQNNSISTKI